MPTHEGKDLVEFTVTNENQQSTQENNSYIDYATFNIKPDLYFQPQNLLPWLFGMASHTKSISLSSLIDGSLNPKICILPHEISKGGSDGKKWYNFGKKLLGSKSLSTRRSIGHIFLNLQHLLDTYKGMRYDEEGGLNDDFSLLGFLKKIWEEDVNNACAGTHNFVIHMPNNIAKVIDLHNNGGIQPKGLYIMDIQSNQSIVREFNFNTTIDSKISHTIAIAAQAPKSVADLDAVSFAAFNKGVESRFSKVTNYDYALDGATLNKKEDTTAIDSRKALEERALKLCNQLYQYKKTIFAGTWKEKEEEAQENITTDPDHETDHILVNDAVIKAKTLEKVLLHLSATYPLQDGEGKAHPKAGERKTTRSKSKSALIPLKFNCKMDGIGGMVIGNVFKVSQSQLPYGYQGADVAFIMFGENQTITAGQDWTTEITGQLMLLDLDNQNIDDYSMRFDIGNATAVSGNGFNWGRGLTLKGKIHNNNPTFNIINYANLASTWPQSAEADWWTLIAILLGENYLPTSCGGSETDLHFQQACCDSGQSIYNRHAWDQHLISQNKGNPYSSDDAGNTFKSIIIAPDTKGSTGLNLYMGAGAYAPTYDNNAEWCLINDKATAITALQNGKAAGGKTWTKPNIEKAFGLCIDGLSNIRLMLNSHSNVGGRPDFLAYPPQQSTKSVTYQAPLQDTFERSPAGKNNCFFWRHTLVRTGTYPAGYKSTAAVTPPNIVKMLGTKS